VPGGATVPPRKELPRRRPKRASIGEVGDEIPYLYLLSIFVVYSVNIIFGKLIKRGAERKFKTIKSS
jgi:hypothetical protein